MKRITFNLNDPSVEQWLEQLLAQGQQQTEIITVALRQAATLTQCRSLREQALHEEIERLYRLIERIAASGKEKILSAEQRSGGNESMATDEWTW